MAILDLYLARHGQSYGQHDTIDDLPPDCETGLMDFDWRLTPLGRRQAEMLGEHLAKVPFDAIYCSPLERARATAHAVEERQPRRTNIQIMRDLLEIGDYGNESVEEFHMRARRAARVLQGDTPTGARVLVVAHSGFNNLLIGALLGLPTQEDLFRFAQQNTGLTRIVFSSEDVPKWERIRLCRMNDLSHLSPEVYAKTLDTTVELKIDY